jgi:hypothetical protein
MLHLGAHWRSDSTVARLHVDLPHDVLPVDPCPQVETVRRHVFATAQRLEADLGPEQFAYDEGFRQPLTALISQAARNELSTGNRYL